MNHKTVNTAEYYIVTNCITQFARLVHKNDLSRILHSLYEPDEEPPEVADLSSPFDNAQVMEELEGHYFSVSHIAFATTIRDFV